MPHAMQQNNIVIAKNILKKNLFAQFTSIYPVHLK